MKIPSARPPHRSDFDLTSPALARVPQAAPGAMQPENVSEISGDSQANIETDFSAPDATSDAANEIDKLEAVPATPASEAANYLGLNEETEDEDEEEDDEPEKPEPLAPHNRIDATVEDYAEFEQIFVRWKETNDPRLRERLILMNRSMVMFLARRFADRGELFEDVLQVGMLGLIYALDGYDLNRGVKFSTFAIPTISGEIRRYFRDKVSGMRVPRGLQELHATLQIRIEELTQQLDRAPTYAEIAFSLKIEVEQVVEAMELGVAIEPLSIDERYYGEESATIAESVGAPDPQLHAYEEHAALQAALEKLPAQERRVLELSFFEGHSQSEIARQMNVSQMHISRLMRRSLSQLKQLLEES